MPRIDLLEAGSQNRLAFLDMIAHSEGTSTVPGSDDGYNVLVGGKLFQGYEKHPLEEGIWLPRFQIYSTAAGRYQVLHKYFEAYASLLALPDFSPRSQDLIALQQIRERKALPLIDQGEFDLAVAACSNIWASLPGNTYGQHQNKLDDLKMVYLAAGGIAA